VDLLDQLVERRIRDAQARGEFDDLEGSGQPLPVEPDVLIDPSLRVAYRILKNSGFVPPEVAQRQRVGNIETLLQQVSDPEKRKPLIARLLKELARLENPDSARADSRAAYYREIVDRLGKPRK
jgi:DnaJ-domain-containing protein 1